MKTSKYAKPLLLADWQWLRQYSPDKVNTKQSENIIYPGSEFKITFAVQ
jgi:hypothetical protein